MSKHAHSFDKQDKKMVDTLVAIMWDKRGTFFSGTELITERHDTIDN